ncbi:MAG TPA: glycosyl hydrolase [Opitutaceae bacterium]
MKTSSFVRLVLPSVRFRSGPTPAARREAPGSSAFNRCARRLCLAGGFGAIATLFGDTGDFHHYTSYNPDLPENRPVAAEFAAPIGFARPQTWWHWINGNVSRAGIENDLREMADKGYGFARIFHINGKLKGPLAFNSPEWFDVFRFATETAARHGIGLGIHNCDGWSEAGGPWITPGQSMKELTFRLVRVAGNGAEQAIPLPVLERRLDYAEDIAVLAWPAKRPAGLAMHRSAVARVYPATPDTKVAGKTLDLLFDGQRRQNVVFAHDNADRRKFCGFTLEFKEPFEAARVFTEVEWMYELPRNIFLEASDDGVTFEKICELKFKQADVQAGFPPRRAKFWRLVRYQSEDPTERVLRGVVREHVLAVSEFELLAPGETSRSASPIANFNAKAGVVAMSGAVAETDEPYPEALALKPGEIQDLTARRSPDGTLRWSVPPGEWIIMRVGYTTTGKTNHPATEAGRGLEVDKFEADAVAHHFDAYDRKMIEAAGGHAGSTFSIIETDSWEAGHQNWTQHFPQYFRELNGYDVIPWLPVYAGECIGDVRTTENFLRDLRQTFSTLVMRNFYGKLGALIRERGLKYETEPAGGIYMRSPMNSFREADFPMNEVWQDAREPGVVPGVRDTPLREVASAAHFYGKKFITCESLTSRKGNWAETPWTMKGTADTVLLAGHNVTVFHTYAHQPDERRPGWQMEPWGVSLNRKLPWWEFSRPWFDYIARNQYMLQQGKFATRLLTLFSDEIPNSGARLAIQGNHTYDVIEGDGVRHFLKVEDGCLVSPGRMRYDLMVISPDTTLRLDTLQALKRLLAAGATMSAQAKPVFYPSLRGGAAAAAAWHALADELFGDGSRQVRAIGQGRLYVGHAPDEVVQSLGIKEAFKCRLVVGEDSEIGWTHREHADGTEWFWVINRNAEAAREGVLSFHVTGKDVQLWHPESGLVEAAPAFVEENGYTHVPLSLEKLEGVFVVFAGKPARSVATRIVVDGREHFPSLAAPAAAGVRASDAAAAPAPRWFVAGDGRLSAEFAAPGVVELHRADRPVVRLAAPELPPPLVIRGPYAVTFDEKWGGPKEPQRFEKLVSWTQAEPAGVRHYSGIAVYTKEIELAPGALAADHRVRLEIEWVAEVAQVTINGRTAGILWRPPYRLDVTDLLRPGRNILRISVANTWVNRCLYDATLPERSV